jgi:hypothetical protein
MSTPTSGGAAFNPAVRTEDNTPAPEPDDEQCDTSNEADDGQTTGEDGS